MSDSDRGRPVVRWVRAESGELGRETFLADVHGHPLSGVLVHVTGGAMAFISGVDVESFHVPRADLRGELYEEILRRVARCLATVEKRSLDSRGRDLVIMLREIGLATFGGCPWNEVVVPEAVGETIERHPDSWHTRACQILDHVAGLVHDQPFGPWSSDHRALELMERLGWLVVVDGEWRARVREEMPRVSVD